MSKGALVPHGNRLQVYVAAAECTELLGQLYFTARLAASVADLEHVTAALRSARPDATEAAAVAMQQSAIEYLADDIAKLAGVLERLHEALARQLPPASVHEPRHPPSITAGWFAPTYAQAVYDLACRVLAAAARFVRPAMPLLGLGPWAVGRERVDRDELRSAYLGGIKPAGAAAADSVLGALQGFDAGATGAALLIEEALVRERVLTGPRNHAPDRSPKTIRALATLLKDRVADDDRLIAAYRKEGSYLKAEAALKQEGLKISDSTIRRAVERREAQEPGSVLGGMAERKSAPALDELVSDGAVRRRRKRRP